MAKRGKKYVDAAKLRDKTKLYTLDEAISLVKKMAEITKRNFDQTVEMAIRLNVDPRYPDQMVRGSVVLPHGLGKPIKVVVFAQGEKADLKSINTNNSTAPKWAKELGHKERK
ncbi:MAG TPA: hypothetical protein EYP03_03690 [Aquificae bacterium]|nr:hypothetical protein [Aquificota bacterium]